jgi:hypothetical protein
VCATNIQQLTFTGTVFGCLFTIPVSFAAYFVIYVANSLEGVLGIVLFLNLKARIHFEHLIRVFVQNGQRRFVCHVYVELFVDALLGFRLNLQQLGIVRL